MDTKCSDIRKMAALLVVLLGAWSVGLATASTINQASSLQKNQILHPLMSEEIYNSMRGGGGYLDSNKIRGYNGVGLNMVESNGNSKRARKISTFMPMRGRKDGNGPRGPGTNLENLFNAYSDMPFFKMRLLEYASALAKHQSEQSDEVEQQQQQSYPINSNNNPQEDEQQQRQQSDQPVHLIGGSAYLNRYVDMDDSGNNMNSQLIQNKLRRAFHPMRGKKSIMDEYTPIEAGQSDPLPTLVY